MLYQADLCNGQYKNPVLYADYSDPDAIRVGDDYFMVASSFSNAPAIPLLHSTDLVNWRVVNYVCDALPEYRYINPQHGSGVWAPAIRHHGGEFFVFFPMPDEGIYVSRTRDPYGKWSAPALILHEAGVIDPCPFWDDDGKLYMVSAVSGARKGYNSVLRLTCLDPVSLLPLSDNKIIYDGRGTIYETIEGPKVHKRGGRYYIFAPAGGVKGGFQAVLRADNIEGPYEIRVCMRQGDAKTNGPHQGAWVDTVTGQDFFIHFQDVYACGRIAHLQPMCWRDGWPVIGRPVAGQTWGEPVDTYDKPDVRVRPEEPCEPENSDDFEGERLSYMWQWNANPDDGWYELEPEKSAIRLNAVRANALRQLSDIRNLMLTKWAAPQFCASMKMNVENLKAGDVAGMVSLGMIFGGIGLRKNVYGDFEVVLISGSQEFDCQEAFTKSEETLWPVDEQKLLEAHYNILFEYNVEVTSRVDVLERKNCLGVEVWVKNSPRETITMRAYYLTDGVKSEIDGAVLTFPARAGRWVGVKYGPFCYNKPLAGTETADASAPVKPDEAQRGYVTVDYVHVTGGRA